MISITFKDIVDCFNLDSHAHNVNSSPLPFLTIDVNLDNRSERIDIFHGDDPLAIANEFCVKNSMIYFN
jgi:hypothetical protein